MDGNFKFIKQLSCFAGVVFLFISLCLITPYGICEDSNAAGVMLSSLKDAVSIAFKNNKDIRIQEEEIEVARANILGAKSAFLPKLNASFGYTHNATVLSLSSATTSKKDAGVLAGYKNDNKIGVSLDESIYNGGADIANFKQAQLGLKVQEETLRQLILVQGRSRRCTGQSMSGMQGFQGRKITGLYFQARLQTYQGLLEGQRLIPQGQRKSLRNT